MDRKNAEIYATIILLIVGISGVVSTIILPQNLNILLLALLPIGLFLQNHKRFMGTFYGKYGFLLTYLRYAIFCVLIIGFAFYIIVNWGVWTPIFMVILSLGLFLANRIFLQNANNP